MNRYIYSIIIFISLNIGNSYAQLTDGLTGLLHMTNAEMQKDGTFILGGNYLNKHNLPNKNWWGYDSFNYYVNITFFSRIEIAYICTLVKGKPGYGYWPEVTWNKFVNQDRHFACKIQLLKEGEWWIHMPSIVMGISDPTTGSGGDYLDFNATVHNNGFFNRSFVALTKNFDLPLGKMGIHFTYLYNKRKDYPLNGPAFGINLRPSFYKNLNLIAEYDAKTINIGALYSLWNDHFNLIFELQDGKYISAGLAYKVNLIGNNRWNSNFFK